MSDLKTYQEALKKASSTIEQLIEENERLKHREPVAVIGMGCRLPGGANSPEEFWQLLAEGRDAVSPIPAERWQASDYYDKNAETPGTMYIREASFLDCSPYAFDPRFFGISPKEAKAMDPQQRLLLEVAWESLEDAGINPASLQGSRTGVFIGISSSDYDSAHLRSGDLSLIDPYSLTGLTFSTAAGRISYTFGLEGPNLPVDTACSSSLVALHLACRSLRSGECDLALVGGVNLMLIPEPLIAFCKLRALSPDGRCKTFDAGADGYGRGEGCGFIVLKRLDAARRDDDRILALVTGSALNNDGRSNGMTVPNGIAQRRVIGAALEDAGLQPGDIDYVEAHGTGTPLGDPIEIEAVAAALCKGRDQANPLLIGSAKTNIGHLEAAAGVAGIIKLVLSLNKEKIPPHLHFSRPNSHIAWDTMPMKVASNGAPWIRSTRPRRAGISGFGFSGTNAHIILEEAPLPEDSRPADRRTSHLLTISAADETALRELAGRYAGYLGRPALPSPAAICHTAATGRNRFPFGLAVAGASAGELAQRLSAFAEQGTTTGLYLRSPQVTDRGGPVFLFTGQGSQYPGMGKELYETAPVYRRELDRCDTLFAPLLGLSIRDLMHSGSEPELARTIYTQPAIFCLEYALARLWLSWGVTPSALMGHSIGEFVAACIAGVLTLEDAVTLVAHRGRLMNSLPAGGVMAALLCPEAQALPMISPHADHVAVAAVNSPGTVVISGEQAGVAAVVDALKQQGVSSQYLTVSHAFHSPLMDPCLDEFEQIAAGLTFHEAKIPVISNVTGRTAVGDDLRTPRYWRRHLRGSVRFGDSIASLKEQGHDLFLEIGASATLSSFVRQTAGADCRCAASLKRGTNPWSTLTAALGELYAAGAGIDWHGFDKPYRSGRVSIPTYPFQREHHIMNPVARPGSGGMPDETCVVRMQHPLLGSYLDSPSPELRFAKAIGTGADAWLAGHNVYGAVIMPAAAYLEMAIAVAAREAQGAKPCLLEQVALLAPLVLTEEARPLQTIYRSETGELEVLSRGNDQRWNRHAGMSVRALSTAVFDFPACSASSIAGRELEGDFFYDDPMEQGFRFEGVFRSIKHLTVRGPDVDALLEVPPEAAHNFILHPVLLDGCLCLPRASFMYGDEPLPEQWVFVPASIESLLYSGRSATKLEARCIQRERNQVSATYDIFAADSAGEPVLQITGLTLRRIRKELLLPQEGVPAGELLYLLQWKEQALLSQQPAAAGSWALLTDGSPFSETVCTGLQSAGVDFLRFETVAGGGRAASARSIDPCSLTEMEVFAHGLKQSAEPVCGIVSLLGDSTAANLTLVRGMLAANLFLPLLLVTTGVHDPLGMEREIRPEGAALWGLGASVAAEAPELSCRLLDLSPWPGSDELNLLMAELSAGDNEDRVVLRGGRRFVSRLCRSDRPGRADGTGCLTLPEGDGFYLDVEQRGSLERLCIRTPGRVAPHSGQVEVQVRAVGLNFRDILNVLGRYPGDPGKLGFECSGVISGVGADVTGLASGDRVFVFNSDGCIADYLTLSASNVIRIPEIWRFEESAAIPVAFLTAWYGLHHLAGVKNGDRVLIHAAAGGVGLAAVQLCQAAGAQVFATAGSPEKRELLRRMGVRQVMDSRSLDFADQIGSVTDGGMDIVLNSLAGEFIDRSLGLLANGGRFIEIGKSDPRTDSEIRGLYPQIVYHRFDLAAIAGQDPPLVASMFNSLFTMFSDGRLTVLPMTIFPMQRAGDAFRFMAQARHIGKVVISLADRVRERRMAEQGVIDPQGTYLISGGLGVLGLSVAAWVVEQGGRHLVLVGRRPPTAEASVVIEELRRKGADPAIMLGDVAQAADVARIMEGVRSGMPPLKGIFHAAGVLDDAMLPEMDTEKLGRVLEPKLAGAWNLHRATEQDDPELFVLFSSLTGVTGSPGQANYAAANAGLDGFARWRRSRGLSAVSIQWGPWGEAGMAAQDGRSERLAARGICGISNAAALQALAQVLRSNPVEQIVADLDLQRLSSFVPDTAAGLYAALFSTHVNQDDSVRGSDQLERLRQAPPAERPGLMLLLIQELAARVMGQSDPCRIESRRPLQEQGFDSLMAVDLRNLMAKTFKKDLPVSLLFDYPTPEKIGRFLLDEALEYGEAGQAAAVASVDPGAREKTADDLVDEIEQLLAG